MDFRNDTYFRIPRLGSNTLLHCTFRIEWHTSLEIWKYCLCLSWLESHVCQVKLCLRGFATPNISAATVLYSYNLVTCDDQHLFYVVKLNLQRQPEKNIIIGVSLYMKRRTLKVCGIGITLDYCHLMIAYVLYYTTAVHD